MFRVFQQRVKTYKFSRHENSETWNESESATQLGSASGLVSLADGNGDPAKSTDSWPSTNGKLFLLSKTWKGEGETTLTDLRIGDDVTGEDGKAYTITDLYFDLGLPSRQGFDRMLFIRRVQ